MIKLITVVMIMLISITASAGEILWGAPVENGYSITGWPTLEKLGGTGRPTQALIVNTSLTHIRSGGPGRDIDGSMWNSPTSACYVGPVGAGPNAVTDFPCPRAAAAIVPVDAAQIITSSVISIDWSDSNSGQFCRHNSTFVHGSGAVEYEEITTDLNHGVPFILHDVDEDVYRYVAVDMGGGLDCENETGDLNTRTSLTYPTAVGDSVSPILDDGTHLSRYGSNWVVQQLYTASWMDQRPATLGVPNLITNGDFETTCTAGNPITFTSGSYANLVRNSYVSNHGQPIVGEGCKWTGMTATATGDTATIAATPGEYYVGSFFVHLNAITVNNRSFEFRVMDEANNPNPTTDYWVEGPLNGLIEHYNTIESDANTGGVLSVDERTAYGGLIVHFAFQVQAGDTGFYLQFETADTHSVSLDELWVRKKVFQDLNRHPIIADGKARIQLFTDSRGASGIRFLEAMDYIAGFPTTNGTRDSMRPNLYMDKAPSTNAFVFSGGSLGNFVGDWDNNEGYGGSANTLNIENRIDGTTNYCVALFGVNDQIGGNSRPTSAALADDADADRHLYWSDQLRGFEQASEKNGCIPIIVMDTAHRADTSVNYCHDKDGDALNCGTWFNEAWKNALHTGF